MTEMDVLMSKMPNIIVFGGVLLLLGFFAGCWLMQCRRSEGVACHAEVAVDKQYGTGSFVSGLLGVKYSTEGYAAFDLKLKDESGLDTNVIVSVDKRVKPVRVVFWPPDSWHIE